MIDSGSSADFRPSAYIKGVLGRSTLGYLFIKNADQDQMSDMKELSGADILTTRRDGWINIDVHPNGMFYTTTEYHG